MRILWCNRTDNHNPEENTMGTPAIAYDDPPARDPIIDWITGIFMPEANLMAMAREAADLFDNKERLTGLSISTLANANHFCRDLTATLFMRILRGSSDCF